MLLHIFFFSFFFQLPPCLSLLLVLKEPHFCSFLTTKEFHFLTLLVLQQNGVNLWMVVLKLWGKKNSIRKIVGSIFRIKGEHLGRLWAAETDGWKGNLFEIVIIVIYCHISRNFTYFLTLRTSNSSVATVSRTNLIWFYIHFSVSLLEILAFRSVD